MTDKYIIRVTAGSDYNVDTHTVVPVNSPELVKISNEFMDVELNVRVQNYKGLPRNSPQTSPYFSQPPHDYNKDQYSISFRFTPKKPSSSSKLKDDAQGGAKCSEDSGVSTGDGADSEESIDGLSAANIQFGNDFDHPIRNRLPPGFNTAMSIVKWWIDPGLDGDVYADEPYLYGPALSSVNAVHIGEGEHDPEKGGLWFEEGGDEAGLETRKTIGAPDTAKARMKWALKDENKEKWIFEYGRTYCADFYNPYLDFGDFTLRLPGFTLPIMKYWDGQGLRYVLRNKSTADTYLVVLFTLYLKEDINEDGSLKPAALASHKMERKEVAEKSSEAEEPEDPKALEEARRKFEELDVEKGNKAQAEETTADDVD